MNNPVFCYAIFAFSIRNSDHNLIFWERQGWRKEGWNMSLGLDSGIFTSNNNHNQRNVINIIINGIKYNNAKFFKQID